MSIDDTSDTHHASARLCLFIEPSRRKLTIITHTEAQIRGRRLTRLVARVRRQTASKLLANIVAVVTLPSRRTTLVGRIDHNRWFMVVVEVLGEHVLGVLCVVLFDFVTTSKSEGHSCPLCVIFRDSLAITASARVCRPRSSALTKHLRA